MSDESEYIRLIRSAYEGILDEEQMSRIIKSARMEHENETRSEELNLEVQRLSDYAGRLHTLLDLEMGMPYVPSERAAEVRAAMKRARRIAWGLEPPENG